MAWRRSPRRRCRWASELIVWPPPLDQWARRYRGDPAAELAHHAAGPRRSRHAAPVPRLASLRQPAILPRRRPVWPSGRLRANGDGRAGGPFLPGEGPWRLGRHGLRGRADRTAGHEQPGTGDRLARSNVVFVSGGNPYHLLQHAILSGFVALVHRWSASAAWSTSASAAARCLPGPTWCRRPRPGPAEGPGPDHDHGHGPGSLHGAPASQRPRASGTPSGLAGAGRRPWPGRGPC
jgi:hypothetical protein